MFLLDQHAVVPGVGITIGKNAAIKITNIVGKVNNAKPKDRKRYLSMPAATGCERNYSRVIASVDQAPDGQKVQLPLLTEAPSYL